MASTASPVFASAHDAETYLAHALPKATRSNPKYLTMKDGSRSEWLTKSVSVSVLPTGAFAVAMNESYTQWQGEVATPGTHKAAFSLADVVIADFTEAGDVTPQGKPARGIQFSCAKPGCVAAEWGGKPSRADKTDIYIQDDAERARIVAAFLFLKGGKSPA